MRWSQILIPTLKEVPQDAEIRSHQLMLRAGLIRRLSSGLYTFLPMGMRSLHKVSNIIREEMNRAGGQEVLMPAMQPRELWERSGRYENMTDVMFNLQDKNGRDMVLGPTHEEVITELVSREINSYKQLPINFYQVQTKFRDEIRPRFGLMRCREFIMKDAYSFDTSWEAADKSYSKMYNAYRRIFARCGLHTMPVDADTGAIGGSASHEFMVIADSGEDGVVVCEPCGYAANLEKAEAQVAERSDADCPAMEEVSTPGKKSIEDVASFLKMDASLMLKTLVFIADETCVIAVLPGDRSINEIKLARVLDVNAVQMANDTTIESQIGAPVGFLGPLAGTKVKVIADARLKGGKGYVTGANKVDTHVQNVDLERDCKIDAYADLCLVEEGDACPKCGKPLDMKRGIEVGHVFKLGTKYSEMLNANFLDADGERQPAVMGCYGIGVTRTLQSALEQVHDDWGIIWPISLAPFEVLICALDPKAADTMERVSEIEVALEAEGISVLVDDRDERPGFKFKDADLIGIPVRLTVGGKGLAKGIVELKVRGEKDMDEVPVADAVSAVSAKVAALHKAIADSVPDC